METPRRRTKRRGRRTRAAKPAHYMNLALFAVTLLVILFGIRALGSGTASCFMDATAPVSQEK